MVEVKAIHARARGRGDGHRIHVINYHHVIHALRRKPQALWGSIYRDCLFPRSEYAEVWIVLQRDLPRRDACHQMVDLLFIAHEQACETELAHLLSADLDAGRMPDPKALALRLAPTFEPAQRFAHPLELARMSIAPNLPSQTRRQAIVVLAQAEPCLARQPGQFAPRCLIKAGIRRMGDINLHHRGIDRDPLEIITLHHPGAFTGLDRLGQQPLHAFLADPVAPPGQGGWVNRQPMLEERLSAKVLPIRVLGLSRHDSLIRKGKGVLKIEQPRHQARRRRRSTGVRWKEPDPFTIEGFPVNQLMPGKEEKGRIADVFVTCDDDIANLAHQIEDLRTEKKALMQQLLTGKRRVVA